MFKSEREEMKDKSCPISGTAFSGIGGQAVMEGVMMRNKKDYAVAVRRADGELVVKKDVYSGIIKNEKVYKIPVLRGILSFIDSMVLGFSTLNFSSDIYIQSAEEEPDTVSDRSSVGYGIGIRTKSDIEKQHSIEEEKASSGSEPGALREPDHNGENAGKDKKEAEGGVKDGILTAVITVFAVILAMGLFMVLPYFASLLFKPLVGEGIILSLIEGVIRLLIFIGYIKLISMMEDIRRVFMYHGAEHKCINCIEAGMPLTLENVRNASREHRRCGTSFLLYVMVISIVFFAFIETDVRWLKILMRIVLIPVIAGVSYELIRLAGKSENPLVKAFSTPGLWLQRLTTREPDDDMIKTGMRSVEEVFDWRAFLKENFGADTAEGDVKEDDA